MVEHIKNEIADTLLYLGALMLTHSPEHALKLLQRLARLNREMIDKVKQLC